MIYRQGKSSLSLSLSIFVLLLSESVSALAREENIKNVKQKMKTLFLSFLYSSEYHGRVS